MLDDVAKVMLISYKVWK